MELNERDALFKQYDLNYLYFEDYRTENMPGYYFVKRGYNIPLISLYFANSVRMNHNRSKEILEASNGKYNWHISSYKFDTIDNLYEALIAITTLKGLQGKNAKDWL